MKTAIFKNLGLLVILFLISSCIKDDDDSNIQCSNNCTLIKGRIFKADGKGIENIEISLHYWLKDKFAYIKRKIGKAFTDSNGNYKMNVFLYDTEIGNSSGILELRIRYDNIEVSLTNNFLKPSDFSKYLNTEYDVYRIKNITNKEVTLEIDYFIPYKSKKSTIALNNYNPINEHDGFSFWLYFPYGFPNNYKVPIIKERFANTTNNTFSFKSIVGKNRLFVTKKKNGVTEKIEEEIEILNKNDSLNLIYNY
ncbi:hypothetical protein ACQY1Q_15850 [Tenacibaculum sp. TC6]|uniref:hypothetical protein n=1 Tax=Tenacibaculum sp. TC6 TaxID=3423223 RepID=UPI003D35F923